MDFCVYSTHIYIPLKMKWYNFSDPLTFNLAP